MANIAGAFRCCCRGAGGKTVDDMDRGADLMLSLPPGIRAVFFDAVGTLLHPVPAAADVYYHAGQRHGSQLSLEEIRRRFATAFRAQEKRDAVAGHRTSEEREVQRWQDIVAAVLDD